MRFRTTILNKYLALQFNNLTSLMIQFSEEVEQVLIIGVQLRNPDKLIATLDVFKSNMDINTFKGCLFALKDYLNSRDFNFVGKYTSRYLFFGMLRQVSTAPFTQSLNDVIESFLSKIPSLPRLPPFNQINSIFSYSSKLIKSLGNSWSMLLYAQCALLSTASATLTSKNSLNHDQTLCLAPNDVVYVYQNAPFHQAQLFILTETHNNDQDKKLKDHFLHEIGEEGDYLLFEGPEVMKEVPCQELGFNSKFKCISWDKADENYQELVAKMQIASRICVARKLELSIGKEDQEKIARKCNEQGLEGVRKVVCAMNTLISDAKKEIVEDLTKKCATEEVNKVSGEHRIKPSNKNAINTLEWLKKSEQHLKAIPPINWPKLFFLAGHNHLVDPLKFEKEHNMSDVTSDDAPYEFREYLDKNWQHVIMRLGK